MNFGEILESKRWKVFTGYVYNLGASVVLLGALFKLQHWAFSGPLLVIGLCTEAFIFFIGAFEPPLELPEWSKVYPELKEDYDPDTVKESSENKLGQLFDKADLSPDLISKISKGLTDLSNTASSISDITSATLATDIYVKNLNSASEAMNTFAEVNNQANNNIHNSVNVLVDSYTTTAHRLAQKGDEMINKLALSGEEFTTRLNQSGSKLLSSYDKVSGAIEHGFDQLGKNSMEYGTNLSRLNKNLEALNTSYESQLKGTADQLNASQKFFSDMTQMNQVIQSSVEEIKKYQSNAAELNKHLEALNSIYGNMLGAMNYKK
ncbi:gliding motility protein GldL [Gaoshiqia sp. Z1-71]|uniref:type IX secretion system motor protein PorL/GldL n=1 Tax=Gaoshiqia hydrogeniformans TaxID=3290090 RepID=UPI003BF822FC